MQFNRAKFSSFRRQALFYLAVAVAALALPLPSLAIVVSSPQSEYLCKALDESDVLNGGPVIGVRLASVVDALEYSDEGFEPVLFAITASLTPVERWLQSHAASRNVQSSVLFDLEKIDSKRIIHDVVDDVNSRDGFSVDEWERFFSILERSVDKADAALKDDRALMVEIAVSESEDSSLSLSAEVIEQSYPGGRMDRSLDEFLYRIEIPLVAVEPEIFLPVMSDRGLEAKGKLYDLAITEATLTDSAGPVR